MKLKTITTLCSILVFSIASIHGQNNAIRFDGSNDYIQLANQVNVTNSNFTFEAWVKPNSTTNGMVFGQDVNGNTNHQLRLAIQSNRARFYFTGNAASPSISLSSAASTVPTNQWTHVAVVRSGTTVTLYLNGVSAATGTSTLINNQSGADASKPFRIGARGGTGNPNGQNNFNGSIDDFRYWNIARTVAQIKANLYYPPSASATGLVLWYKMDAGSGSSAVNSATNVPGNNGALVNAPTWVASPIAYAQNSIDLDGLSDMVSIGAPLSNNASFTKEAWVYANENIGNLNLLSSNGSPFWINAGRLKAGIGGNIEVITDPGTFPLNTWTHVAVTFDDASNTMRLYRNGTLVATNSAVTLQYSGENMYIGSWQGTMSFFEGRIDEVRIWNVARTALQIQNSRNMEISPAAEANLVSYYTFNQGITNGTNAGINTVIDQKGSFNGTISGLALSGATSNFVSQYASLALLPLRW
ncbi:MAG: LamG domain-containing protein, partial [Sphingobacteriales bacterium]